jgi:hypothetical protein
MSTAYKWSITKLDVMPQSEHGKDYVVVATWECRGERDGASHTASASCVLPPVSGTFVPFSSLTEATVLDWCWKAGVDKAFAEAAVNQHIEYKLNPPVVSKSLPWDVA